MQRKLLIACPLAGLLLRVVDDVLADLREAASAAQLVRRQVLVVPGLQVVGVGDEQRHEHRVAVECSQVQRRVVVVVELFQQAVHLQLVDDVFNDAHVAIQTGQVEEGLARAVLAEQEGLEGRALFEVLVDEVDNFEAAFLGRQVEHCVLFAVLGGEEAGALGVEVLEEVLEAVEVGVLGADVVG